MELHLIVFVFTTSLLTSTVENSP